MSLRALRGSLSRIMEGGHHRDYVPAAEPDVTAQRPSWSPMPGFPYEEWLRSAVSASLWYWHSREEAEDFMAFTDEDIVRFPYRHCAVDGGRTFTRIRGPDGSELHISVNGSDSGMVIVDGLEGVTGFDPRSVAHEEVEHFCRWCPEISDAEIRIVLLC